MPTAFDRLAYAASQGLRRTWFRGHYLVSAASERRARLPLPSRPLPSRERLQADLKALFDADWAAIAAGRYAMPADLWGDPRRALAASRAYLADLPAVARRRRDKEHQEVAGDAAFARLPRYYRQNFHYQTDGWLSERSAALYDFQVEVLFGGGADAMRRGALIPIGEALRRAGPGARLLDLGCGTGRFLAQVKDNWPRLSVTGVDLSAPYLAAARRTLADRRAVLLAQAAAERLPLPDRSVDVVTCVYLLHELPPGIRRRVAAEIGRVLRPGGRLILVDSLQTGDRPDYDGLLERFPAAFHEPYFSTWLETDLDALFAIAGLTSSGSELRFLSKIASFERVGA
ncbi:MAG: class I SAM-dependent methyltransferase [Alphaproteobacteria bacterium]